MTRRGWIWLTAAITAAVVGLVLWLETGPPAGKVPENVVGPLAVVGGGLAGGGSEALGEVAPPTAFASRARSDWRNGRRRLRRARKGPARQVRDPTPRTWARSTPSTSAPRSRS